MQITRFEMEGARELDRKLERLGTEVATEIGVDAVQESAEALTDAWRKVAPYDARQKLKTYTSTSGEVRRTDYGHLRDEIRFRREGTDNPNVIAFLVTTGRAFWAYFYEMGTAHQPPRPTFRPVTENMKEELVTIQAETLRAGIEAAAGRG